MEAARSHTIECYGMAERDLGPITQCFDNPTKSFDLNNFIGREHLQRTEYYNELWQVLHVERALMACLEAPTEPLATFAITRTAREPAFRPKDIVNLERLRQPTERRLAELVEERQRSVASEDVLPALYEVLPSPCLVFNHQGLLLWANKAAQRALNLRLTLLGGPRGRTILTPRPELAQVRASLLEIDAAGLCCATFQNVFRAQRVDLRDRHPVWVVTDGDGGRRAPVASSIRLRQLTSREMDVATLAADGCSALTIASRLDIVESTVKVHLRNVYRKLGLHTRAELARAVVGLP
jgi:DNA-binding CsgD family transcriptional regulator